MPKENQRVAISKRLLKEGILHLLEKKNIDHISVSELCAVSGINRTTFYRHYQTPHDVLLEMEMDFIKDIHTIPIPSGNLNDLKSYAVLLCNYIFDHKDTVKIFICNNTDTDFLLLFQTFSNEFLAINKILYMGKPIEPSKIQLMQTFFSYGSYAMVKEWLMKDLPFSPNDIAEMLLSPLSKVFSFA